MLESPVAIKGLSRAIERFGKPIVWHKQLRFGAKTMGYYRGIGDGRVAEVVIALRRPSGCYLLHTKSFYPEGTYRLLSGGINPDEDLIDALVREAFEETGLQITVERFVGLVHHLFVHEHREMPFSSCIFEVTEAGGTLRLEDTAEQISGYHETDAKGLIEIARDLESLPPQWRDWGRFRAVAHRLAGSVLSVEEAQ